MEKSIKDRVIALAKTDPFLTVKELAREAGTSVPYVRTILSEAGLSLNEMRRSYARRLERTSGAGSAVEDIPVQAELTVTKVAGARLAPAVKEWAELELFQAGCLGRLGPVPCYMQLITPRELQLPADFDHLSLRELIPAADPDRIEVSGQRAEVVAAPAQLCELLNLPQGAQAAKLTSFLTDGTGPLALEIIWLSLEGLVLEWSKRSPELEVRVGS